MMLIRTKYKKEKSVRYISHLELMDTMRHAFRRARLPVAFTQGYNPHIVLSLSQPLSVGMIGKGEYFDLELRENVDIDDYIERVNDSLPGGLEVLAAREIPESVKSLQAVVNTAIYRIDMDFTDQSKEKEILDKYRELREIKIVRHRRNKEDRELDLAPMIYSVEQVKPGCWDFVVSTGSQGNVRPAEIVRSLTERYNEVNKVPLINIIRRGLFVRIDEKLFSPYDNKVIGS